MSEIIKFWRTTDKPYGCFSNFAQYGFTKNNLRYATSEHYYQSQKTLDKDISEKIRLAKTPKESKQLANSYPLRPDWENIKYSVMKEALILKFEQNLSLKKLLIETKNNVLIEDSPYDYIWGCGKNGSGQNLLGKCLMEVREYLTKDLISVT
jgi:ribA/ribD-fused uncharacterized protein